MKTLYTTKINGDTVFLTEKKQGFKCRKVTERQAIRKLRERLGSQRYITTYKPKKDFELISNCYGFVGITYKTN